jgi:hypothetical protein
VQAVDRAAIRQDRGTAVAQLVVAVSQGAQVAGFAQQFTAFAVGEAQLVVDDALAPVVAEHFRLQ